MADVLSQSEVQSLLAALVPDSSKLRQPGFAIKSQPEPLFEFVDDEPLLSLGELHEEFAGEFATALGGILRSVVDVKLTNVERLTCRESLARAGNPACLVVWQSQGLAGRMALELSPSILFPLIDRMLGGGKAQKSVVPARALTDIELALVSRIAAVAARGLESAWQKYCKLQLAVAQIECDPQRVQVTPHDEMVYSIQFELTLGELSGPMQMCIPVSIIEPIVDKLSLGRADCLSTSGGGNVSRQNGVKLVVRLGETKLSAKEIANLAVGDIIMTEHPTSQGLDVLIEGRVLYDGLAGVFQGHKAVRIRSSMAGPSGFRTNESGVPQSDSPNPHSSRRAAP